MTVNIPADVKLFHHSLMLIKGNFMEDEKWMENVLVKLNLIYDL